MIAYKKLACFIKVINKIRRLKKAIKILLYQFYLINNFRGNYEINNFNTFSLLFLYIFPTKMHFIIDQN